MLSDVITPFFGAPLVPLTILVAVKLEMLLV